MEPPRGRPISDPDPADRLVAPAADLIQRSVPAWFPLNRAELWGRQNLEVTDGPCRPVPITQKVATDQINKGLPAGFL